MINLIVVDLVFRRGQRRPAGRRGFVGSGADLMMIPLIRSSDHESARGSGGYSNHFHGRFFDHGGGRAGASQDLHFRKTTATVLDGAGLTAREVADRLGHSKTSMTLDGYMGRGVVNPKAAKALEGLAPES